MFVLLPLTPIAAAGALLVAVVVLLLRRWAAGAVALVGALGHSYEEAAEICKCAVGTIKSRVSRARTRLADMLGIEGDGEYGPDSISSQIIGVAPAA